jgi:hypothetical protein
MRNPGTNEKNELIEQALHESVSGGLRDACGFSCYSFGFDVCEFETCAEVCSNEF